ncbi:MAG: hypothetical protein ACRC4O_05435 [Giesbergeria sp.]
MNDWLRGARVGLLGAVLAIGCKPDHPAAIPVGDACDRAQGRLVELGCDWRVNSAGGTWASSCTYLAEKGYGRIHVVAECVASSTSCTGARACH